MARNPPNPSSLNPSKSYFFVPVALLTLALYLFPAMNLYRTSVFMMHSFYYFLALICALWVLQVIRYLRSIEFVPKVFIIQNYPYLLFPW